MSISLADVELVAVLSAAGDLALELFGCWDGAAISASAVSTWNIHLVMFIVYYSLGIDSTVCRPRPRRIGCGKFRHCTGQASVFDPALATRGRRSTGLV